MKKYSKEFKLEAVRLSHEQGGAKTARELGIQPNMLYKWRQELASDQAEAFRGKGNLKAQDAELARLKRELASVKEERDILKKVIAIFSK